MNRTPTTTSSIHDAKHSAAGLKKAALWHSFCAQLPLNGARMQTIEEWFPRLEPIRPTFEFALRSARRLKAYSVSKHLIARSTPTMRKPPFIGVSETRQLLVTTPKGPCPNPWVDRAYIHGQKPDPRSAAMAERSINSSQNISPMRGVK